jgi:hypothetical protein
MLESLDLIPLRVYERFLGEADELSLDAVLARADEVGADPVYRTMVKLGESVDRRLGHHITAGAFVVAVSGISLSGGAGSEITLQSLLSGSAGGLGALSFLFALRGTTRQVEQQAQVVRDLRASDVEMAWILLRRKTAWGWASVRARWPAAVLMGLAPIVGGFAT